MKEQVIHAEEQVMYFDTNFLDSKESGLRYFKMPQFLVSNPRFWKLSSDAKVVYCVMLNRLPLSMKNGWKVDGLFYIYFSIETVQKIIQCSKSKAVRVMKELKNFKLIEGRRCADHRRMRYLFLDISLYVPTMSAAFNEDVPAADDSPENNCPDEHSESEKETQDCDSKDEDICPDTGLNLNPDRSEPDTCTGSGNEPEQVSKADRKETEFTKTDSFQKDHHQREQRRWRWTKEEWKEDLSLMWKGDEDELMPLYDEGIQPRMDRLIESVSSVLSQKEQFKINGSFVDVEDVHMRLMTLSSEEVGYALDYLYSGSYQCSSFPAYAVSVLYNAPEQSERYWTHKVSQEERWNQGYSGSYGSQYSYGYPAAV